MHSQVTTHCDALSFALLVDCVCTCMWVTMDKWTSGWVNVCICADVWNLDVWKDGMLMRCMRDGRRDEYGYGYVCMSYMYYLIRDERREIRDRESEGEGENEEATRKEEWK